jgi:heme/copper-type cytochrome/quinol oxidase subunit 2
MIPLIIFLAIIGGIIYILFKYRERIEILKEFFEFLKERKLLWIAPIIIILLLAGVIIIFAEGGALSSVIYALF